MLPQNRPETKKALLFEESKAFVTAAGFYLA
jgi:hypothetical protein